MKLGTMLMLLAAIVAGSVAVITAKSIIRNGAAGPVVESSIVVAARDLAFGEAVTDDNVVEIPWSSRTVPDGAFATKEQMMKDGQRVVLSNIGKNEAIRVPLVTGPGQRGSLSVRIQPGMRAVTIRVDDVRGVAGFVLPDDHVDVLLTRLEGNSTNSAAASYADVLLQNVKVLAVDQLASNKQESPTVAKAVTLEVTTEQGQKLFLAGGVGSLSLVLRQAGGAEADPARRITMVDLSQGEYLGGERNAAKDGLLAQRLDALEARLADEMKRRVPEAPQAEPPKVEAPKIRQGANVRVIRAAKPEEYSVYSEGE